MCGYCQSENFKDIINYAELTFILYLFTHVFTCLLFLLSGCMLRKGNDVENFKDFKYFSCTVYVTQQFPSASRLLWLSLLKSGSSCPHSSRFSLPGRAPMQLASFGCCLLSDRQLPVFVELYAVEALTHPWPAIFSETLNIGQLLLHCCYRCPWPPHLCVMNFNLARCV